MENEIKSVSAALDPNLTEQQRNAVIHRGKTLLVSAGAGSGKTSTLSKRIISRISDPDDPVEIDDFLIVTFTNASAKDLSEKIEKAVSSCVAKDLSNKKAMRQLAKIKYANISTISSFCLGVVKKHFQMLSLPAKIRICDGAEAELLLRRVTEGVVEEMYSVSQDGAAFFDAVEIFSGSKSDEGFISLIQRLYKKIMSYPEPTKWCEKALGFYKEISEKEDYLDTAYGKVGFDIIKSDLEGYIDGLNSAIEKMNGEEKYEKYISIFSQDLENARFALSHLDENDYEKTRSCLSSVTSTRLIALPTKKYDFDEYEVETIKALRGENYELFNSHRKAFFSADEEKIKAASVDCHRILSAVFDMIFVIDERYTSEKNERGFIDFADAERYTYKLFVKENDEESGKLEITEIAEKYKKAFKEIYIDEYQDINPIQDTIFRAICRYDERGCETNRFMVGDIKQSIYRFRGARPDLFASYLDRFTRIGEGDGMTENKEFLAQNFRCSKGVVDFTNLVFSAIMKDSYGDGDRLVFSRREDFKVDSPSEIVLFSKDESDGKDYYTDEMKATALKIKEIVNNPDILSADGKMYTYGDITVLLPKVKNVAEKYAKYFENCGIPAYSEVSENFFENAETLLCLCLLNAIDNPLRDVYVTGAMRSEIFMFSDDDLLTIRRLSQSVTSSDRCMWQSVKDMAEKGDGELSEKCRNFVSVIEKFRKYSVGTSSDKLLLKLYSELHLMNVVSEKSFNRYTESAPLRRENLMILYNLARGFEKTSFRGLCAFLEFLKDRIEDPKDIISASSSEGASSVRIMSVHHSKGLEFPVCFLCGLSSAFNKSDEQASCIQSDYSGIAFKLCDLPSVKSCESSTSSVKYDTPFRCAVKYSETKLALEEQKRLLYVAMTRAKDRLVVMLEKPEEKKLVSYYEKGKNTGRYITRANSFADWIFPVITGYDCMSAVFDEIGFERSLVKTDENRSFAVSELVAKAFYSNEKTENENESENVSKISDEIKERLSFAYPFASLSKIPSKISVTDIKNGKLNADDKNIIPSSDELVSPGFLSDRTVLSAEIGTAMHTFMQYADFKKCEDSVEAEARRLLESAFITGEQFGMLDFEKLSMFFESGIYKEISRAKKVNRETAFAINLPISELYEETSASEFSGESTLIQGKIDCFFEDENGRFTIIDFKTDKVSDINELSKRYSLQLHYYKRAVREMTGREDIRTVIYSFSHSDYIEL